MKIYQITEAPRIDPTFGKATPASNSGPTLSSPSTASGGPLKGQSLKLNGVSYQFKGKSWVVTDTSEFKGKNPPKLGQLADRNAKELLNQKSAKLNGGSAKTNTLKATQPATTITPDAPKADPKPDAPKADPKPEADGKKGKPKFKAGWKTFGALGGLISAGLLGQEIIESSGEYAEALDKHNGDTSQEEVQDARQYLANVCADAVVQLFLSIASGAIAGSIASRALVGIPGAGWIAALVVGSATTIVSYAASKAAKGQAFIDGIAKWMMRTIDDDLLRNLTDDVSTGASSEKAQAKDAMKDLILNDPKMMQAFKLAKKTKATKAAV